MLDGGADYLVRDPFTAGNRRTFTFSCWLKRSAIGSQGGTTGNNIFGGDRTGTFSDRIMFGSADDGNDQLETSYHDGSSGLVKTSALYRDPTAWMNVVWVVDTTQSTDTNRVKVYVNGSLVTFNSPSYPTQNYDTAINNTENQAIGVRAGTLTQQHFGGYMAEVILLDGTAESDASKFGELDANGVWVPIEPSGLTFGTNGFHLKFDEAALLGKSSNSTTNPTVSFLGSQVFSSAAQTFTVSGATLGDAASNRTIVVAAGGGRANAGTRSINTLSVGGTSATFIARKNSGGGNVMEFWSVAKPSDTTGDIVVEFSGGNNNMEFVGIAWWRVLDAGQPISIDSNTGSSWSTQAVTTIGQTGDVALYALEDSAGVPPNITGYSWSDATERAEHLNITSSSSTHNAFVAADYTFTSSESHTETVTVGGGQGNDNTYLGITFSNNNSFETNSIAAANQVTDTCTDDAETIGNYVTWNSVDKDSNVTLSEGNTVAEQDNNTSFKNVLATQVVPSSGKWVWEIKQSGGQPFAGYATTGVASTDVSRSIGRSGAGAITFDYQTSSNKIRKFGGGTTEADYATSVSMSSGEAFQFAIDSDAEELKIFVNNTQEGSTLDISSLTKPYKIISQIASNGTVDHTLVANSADFENNVPSGYKPINTANLPAPTVKDPDDGFALITLEDGNTIEASLATARSGFGSFIDVFKREDGTDEDYDVRFSDDSGNSMHFNTNAAAGSEATLASGVNYSAWSWRVGATYGCYTAEISHTNGSATNQAHGLGSGAKSAVAKRSDSTGDWYVSHPNMSSANIRWNVQDRPSTTELVTVDGTNITLNSSFASGTYRVIVWEQIDGFSAFVGYTHNGSTTDGPYVPLGGLSSLVAWRNIDSSNSNDFFATFPSYTSNGNGNPTDIRYNWNNGEKGFSGITIGDVTANGYKMRPSSGSGFGKDDGDPMLVWAWGLRPFGGSGVAQAKVK